MIKKIKLILILMILINFILGSVDMNFGIFNYKGSRLKKIVRSFVRDGIKSPGDQVEYEYDKDGYLIHRKLSGFETKSTTYPIDITTLEYLDKGKTIYENFVSYVNRDKLIVKGRMEYYYDENNRLLNYRRNDSKPNDNKITPASDVEIKYNEQGDIVYIRDKLHIGGYEAYFPGEGLVGDSSGVEFDYEYLTNMKIQKEIFDTGKKVVRSEYLFNKDKLEKVIRYFIKEKNDINYTTFFYYDDKGNIIETLTEAKSGPYGPFKVKTLYEYDNKDRLIKRIIYFPLDDNKQEKEKINQIEEYFYEDGNLVYYPYLLPDTKIKIYLLLSDVAIDKSMF